MEKAAIRRKYCSQSDEGRIAIQFATICFPRIYSWFCNKKNFIELLWGISCLDLQFAHCRYVHRTYNMLLHSSLQNVFVIKIDIERMGCWRV